jgi:hypothetical protein
MRAISTAVCYSSHPAALRLLPSGFALGELVHALMRQAEQACGIASAHLQSPAS